MAIIGNRTLLHMRDSKIVAAGIFNELQAVGPFLAFDSASTRTEPFTSGKNYRNLVNNGQQYTYKTMFIVCRLHP